MRYLILGLMIGCAALGSNSTNPSIDPINTALGVSGGTFAVLSQIYLLGYAIRDKKVGADYSFLGLALVGGLSFLSYSVRINDLFYIVSQSIFSGSGIAIIFLKWHFSRSTQQ